MIESKIVRCLQEHAIKIINDKNIKCINVNFNPPVDKKWWELIYIPNNVDDEFWSGNSKTYRGVFRIALHWPQKSQGVYKPLEEMERVADGFEKDTQLFSDDGKVRITVIDTPSITMISEDKPYLLIGLTIKYSCFIM